MDRPLVTRLELPIDPAEALSPLPTCPTLAGALLLPLAPRGWSLRVAPRAAGARALVTSRGCTWPLAPQRTHTAPPPRGGATGRGGPAGDDTIQRTKMR